MIDVQEFFWDISVVSLFLCFLQGLKHTIYVSLKKLISASPSRPENTNEQVFESENHTKDSYGDLAMNGSDDSVLMEKIVEVKRLSKLEKRPPMLAVPKNRPGFEFSDMGRREEKKEFEVEGKGFFLASKKGKREFMEDGFGIMLDIMGDTKQAFFAVIDGHGGRAAADYVAENLGKNIVKELECTKRPEDHHLEALIRRSYSITDKDFLLKGVNGGACVAGVLLKDGELHVANAGDCRVVLSRNGAAFPLTNDHRLTREDERFRIENSGGYVDCRHGVWRVNGALAVSRAIGDLHLKEWIISEPEYQKYPITSDSEFLIMASDGLWDKVKNQEAVDVIRRENSSVESCRKLVDMSCSRGNLDDTTVVVINLQKFLQNAG